MVDSPVQRKHLSTTEPNVTPIENFGIFFSKQRRGEIGKGDIERKEKRKKNFLGSYCSSNTQVKRYKASHGTFPGYTNIKGTLTS